MSAGATERWPALLRRQGPFALLAAGRTALREVPGLRALLLKGFLLVYGLFLVLGFVVLGLGYRYLVQPLSQGLSDWRMDGGFLVELIFPLLAGLLWLGQAVLLAATLLLAFLLALSLMSVWFEALASRIVRHARGGGMAEAPFSMAAWARSLGGALRDSLLLLALAVVSLLLGFLPLIGPFLALGLAGFLMGWEVREPYLAVRAAEGTPLKELRRGLGPWTVRIGLLPVLLALVPLAGWLLMPAVLIAMVAGVAWSGEQGGRTA
jgi:uncharacterized protein involved in cysteine biosynthesis